MRSARLSHAVDTAALLLPDTGTIAVLRPRGEDDLSALPKPGLVLEQGFRPDHDALAAQGLPRLLTTAPLILPTPETALRAGFDALIERMGIVPRIAAEADDMAMLRLLARAHAGLAVIPPVVVRDAGPGPDPLAPGEPRST